MKVVDAVVFSIDPSHWDAIERAVEEPTEFRLFDGSHEIRGKFLRLEKRPRVVCEVEEESWIQ